MLNYRTDSELNFQFINARRRETATTRSVIHTVYVIYSQDTVIYNITAILYVSVKCVQCNPKKYIYITINSVPYQYFGLLTM